MEAAGETGRQLSADVEVKSRILEIHLESTLDVRLDLFHQDFVCWLIIRKEKYLLVGLQEPRSDILTESENFAGFLARLALLCSRIRGRFIVLLYRSH